ncbi:ABC transporter permease [Paenibacillus sp. FSL H8-0034]|uniref:ABC transporter permease n=1 Tax=Paenibacillus sp. FSL H8-0034 TaxID=2954671 RepID=UPI0030FA874B
MAADNAKSQAVGSYTAPSVAPELGKEQRRRIFRRFITNTGVVAGSVILLIIIVLSLFPGWFATHDPYLIDVASRFQKPNAEHLFGTDNFGRDVWSRVVYGVKISAEVGFAVSLGSSILGLIIGLYASYYRTLDHLFMRISDGLMAFPGILLALAIMAMLGPSIRNLVICLIAVITPHVARVIRSTALIIREQTYIEAMKALGASSTRILWGHIALNSISNLIVQASFIFVEAIIVEAALSFLGAGVPLPTPSLGNMLIDGKMYIFNSWWMTAFPGAAILVLALAFNLFGDGLRDFLDPHTTARK